MKLMDCVVSGGGNATENRVQESRPQAKSENENVEHRPNLVGGKAAGQPEGEEFSERFLMKHYCVLFNSFDRL